MKITVGELVDRCPAGVEVRVDAGLERRIRWVHPTEIADPTDYLEGGEVILTAGVWMEGGTPPATVVKNLSAAGAAAVGFGLTKRNPSVPKALVNACRRHRLNLFSVAIDVPFLAIMGVFVDAVSKEREAPLEEAVHLNERFLAASGAEDPVAALVRTLGRYCRAGCHVVDPLGQVMANSEVSAEPEELEELGLEGVGSNPSGDRRIAFPIGSSENPDAWLVSAPRRGTLSVAERAAIEQALPFLALAFARRRALRESARRFAAELVDLLLAGEAAAPAAKARVEAFELDLKAGLIAVVARAGEVERALETLEDVYRKHRLRATVTTKHREVISVVQADTAELGPVLEDARLRLEEGNGAPAALGYGEPATNVAALRKSLIEAQHACLVAWSKEGGGCASHAEVGSHLLLVALQDQEVLAHFRQATLSPLEEHDARSQVSLLDTLDAFLNSGGRWSDTASQLYIHVNTLRHRLRKVEELTGRDLSSMADRVDFFIALRSRERAASVA